MGWYFTGDSLDRKSRREGSRLRRGSVEGSSGVEENQPIVGAIAIDCGLGRQWAL